MAGIATENKPKDGDEPRKPWWHLRRHLLRRRGRRSAAGAEAWRNDSVDAADGDDVDIHAVVLTQEDDAAGDDLAAAGHRAALGAPDVWDPGGGVCMELASIAGRSFRCSPYGKIICVHVPVCIHWTISIYGLINALISSTVNLHCLLQQIEMMQGKRRANKAYLLFKKGSAGPRLRIPPMMDGTWPAVGLPWSMTTETAAVAGEAL